MVERRGDGSGVGVDTIVGATLRKWQRLRRQLEGFVGKHDYRNAESITEDEAMSWAIVIGFPVVVPESLACRDHRDLRRAHTL